MYIIAQHQNSFYLYNLLPTLLCCFSQVLYLIEPIDEYTIQALPEFDSKKFQNAAKEGLDIDSEEGKEKLENLNKEFEPLTVWLKEKALADHIEKAVVSARLTTSPCALVASSYGWTGNMERIMKSQVRYIHVPVYA